MRIKQSAVPALLLPLIVFLMGTLSLHAQSTEIARVLRVTYYDDNQLMIQLALSGNASIVGANLRVDNQTLSLNIEGEVSRVEQWFLLDAGVTMRDAIPLLKDELPGFVADNPLETLNAGIIFADSTIILEVDSDPASFTAWLENYTLAVDSQTCTVNVLSELPHLSENPRHVQHILLITSAASDTCPDSVPVPDIAIDVIALGRADDSIYQQLAEDSGGFYYESSVLGLSEGLSNIRQLWSDPVILLSTALDAGFDSAELLITLENGETLNLPIQPSGEFHLPPTATATPTITPTATASPVPVTATVSPTEGTSPAENTASVTPESTEILATQNQATLTDMPDNIDESESPALRNTQYIVGIGAFAAFLVILVVIYLLRFRQTDTATEIVDDMHRNDPTIVLDEDTSMQDMTNMLPDASANDVTRHKVAELIDENTATVYDIYRPITTLGRREGNDILIEGDSQISRTHIRFITRDDGIIQASRMTTNPIMVNGVAITMSQALQDGDVLTLSPTLTVIFQQIFDDDEQGEA